MSAEHEPEAADSAELATARGAAAATGTRGPTRSAAA